MVGMDACIEKAAHKTKNAKNFFIISPKFWLTYLYIFRGQKQPDNLCVALSQLCSYILMMNKMFKYIFGGFMAAKKPMPTKKPAKKAKKK